ncbi:hypothetical protein M1O13_02675, partial [Dehalococcoidia bacterium]|nr:hypothetical protein [Dehalococcoidia bacterium]
ACHSEGAKRPKNLLMQGSRDSSPLAQNDTPIELYFRNKPDSYQTQLRPDIAKQVPEKVRTVQNGNRWRPGGWSIYDEKQLGQ